MSCRDTNSVTWKPVDRSTSGGVRWTRDKKGETEKDIYNGNGVPSKGIRHWG